MDFEPARIAAMLQPLADKHNAPHRRAKAEADAQGRRYAFACLTGWDLARLWMVAGACLSVAEIRAAADLGIHTTTAGLKALEQGGWLARIPTAMGDQFEQRMPLVVSDNPPLPGPQQVGTGLVM